MEEHPPFPASLYEIWMLDSSDWNMLDTYQLNEFEHGMSMKLVRLSYVPPDTTGSSSTNVEETKSHESSTFLVVGTGIINGDGEDVSSNGRILLFEVRRVGDRTGKYEAELNFVYEKEMSLGPVTSVTSLSSQGVSRLIIGAGAEKTVEQWGNHKLTQVGFFHCNTQVQDISIFKNSSVPVRYVLGGTIKE